MAIKIIFYRHIKNVCLLNYKEPLIEVDRVENAQLFVYLFFFFLELLILIVVVTYLSRNSIENISILILLALFLTSSYNSVNSVSYFISSHLITKKIRIIMNSFISIVMTGIKMSDP